MTDERFKKISDIVGVISLLSLPCVCAWALWIFGWFGARYRVDSIYYEPDRRGHTEISVFKHGDIVYNDSFYWLPKEKDSIISEHMSLAKTGSEY